MTSLDNNYISFVPTEPIKVAPKIGQKAHDRTEGTCMIGHDRTEGT